MCLQVDVRQPAQQRKEGGWISVQRNKRGGVENKGGGRCGVDWRAVGAPYGGPSAGRQRQAWAGSGAAAASCGLLGDPARSVAEHGTGGGLGTGDRARRARDRPSVRVGRSRAADAASGRRVQGRPRPRPGRRTI